MIESIDLQKKKIRSRMKEMKKEISLSEKKKRSAIILAKLEKDATFMAANCIMLYWSMEDEVYTHDFVCKWANKKRVILPCVDGSNLLLKEFKGREFLVDGENYGIPEPDGEVINNIEDIDFILVPGVAFDQENNRMGRGKAYYDKILTNLTAYKLGVCFDFQLLKKVPTDVYDVKMDSILI